MDLSFTTIIFSPGMFFIRYAVVFFGILILVAQFDGSMQLPTWHICKGRHPAMH